MKSRIIYAAFILLLLTCEQVCAATAEATFTSAGLRMFWGLLVVLGVLLIIYGFVKKRLSPVYTNTKSKIKILEIRHLMPKKSLCLVEVSGKEYLIGLGNDTITLLSSSAGEDVRETRNAFEKTPEEHEQSSL